MSTVTLPAEAPPAAIAPEPEPQAAGVFRAPSIALGVGIIATVLVIASLYLARAFFVPLVIGILSSYTLTPLVDLLRSWRIPRAIGAALVLGTIAALLAWGTVAIGSDAAAMVARLPEAAQKVRDQVRASSANGPSSLQKIQEAATTLEGAAVDASARPPAKGSPARPARAETAPGAWLQDAMFAQGALLATVLAQAPLVLLLTYFLLASGEHFRRKLVQFVGPSLSVKKETVRILEEIDVQIQRNLFATVGANVLVGLGTWLAFAALGVENAAAWGAGAGILHFVPYLGPMAFAVASGVAAFLQFGSASQGLAVAAISLVVATAAGALVMTWLQSRFARINAAVLFIALIFFGWLWGIWGLLLGAPLVAIAKVICDRVDALKPAGELLGH
jgi:predicted PurR-regulated permease PerM